MHYYLWASFLWFSFCTLIKILNLANPKNDDRLYDLIGVFINLPLAIWAGVLAFR